MQFTHTYDPPAVELFQMFTLVDSKGRDVWEVKNRRHRASNNRRDKPMRQHADPLRIAELQLAFAMCEEEGKASGLPESDWESPFDGLLGDDMYSPGGYTRGRGGCRES